MGTLYFLAVQVDPPLPADMGRHFVRACENNVWTIDGTKIHVKPGMVVSFPSAELAADAIERDVAKPLVFEYGDFLPIPVENDLGLLEGMDIGVQVSAAHVDRMEAEARAAQMAQIAAVKGLQGSNAGA
jgi:hypothetical protein